MGNGWKSAAVCGLAIVGLFAFASDADAFWGRRHGCGHQSHQGCHAVRQGCQTVHHVAYAPAAGCCDAAPVAEAASCCESTPIAEASSCCGSATVHHVGYASQGRCCGGGGQVVRHRRHVGYGGGCCGGGHTTHATPVHVQSAGGCSNCQAPW